uniref:Uncharacterized protein n=1 Tax=Sphaerodactylus townsendi TaxID=933632 RepID=A0ACB8FCN5_9SAUR
MEWLSGAKRADQRDPRGSKRKQRSSATGHRDRSVEEVPASDQEGHSGDWAAAVMQTYQPLEKRASNPYKSRRAEGKDCKGRDQPTDKRGDGATSTAQAIPEGFDAAMDTTPAQASISEKGEQVAEQVARPAKAPQPDVPHCAAASEHGASGAGAIGEDPDTSSGTPIRPSQTPHTTPATSEESAGSRETKRPVRPNGGLRGRGTGPVGDDKRGAGSKPRPQPALPDKGGGPPQSPGPSGATDPHLAHPPSEVAAPPSMQSEQHRAAGQRLWTWGPSLLSYRMERQGGVVVLLHHSSCWTVSRKIDAEPGQLWVVNLNIKGDMPQDNLAVRVCAVYGPQDRDHRHALWATLKDLTAAQGLTYVVLGNFNNRVRPEYRCVTVRRSSGEGTDGRRGELQPADPERLNREE